MIYKRCGGEEDPELRIEGRGGKQRLAGQWWRSDSRMWPRLVELPTRAAHVGNSDGLGVGYGWRGQCQICLNCLAGLVETDDGLRCYRKTPSSRRLLPVPLV